MNFHARLAILAKLSFSPYFPNSPVSPTFMGPLIALCFALLAIVAILSFSPYLLNSPVSPTFMGPLIALCFAMLAILAKLSFSPYLPNSPVSPTFMGPPHCFVLCHVGDSGKIVIFAIFAKFASIANFYGAPSLLCALPCWRFWQNCHFRHICQIRQYRQLLWGPLIALCFAMLAILAKLSFSPYLPNSPVSPTFMGPLIALCFAMLAILAKLSFLPYLPNSPVSPTFMGPLIALCFAMLAILAKLSFSPYLPNSPVSLTFMGPPHCFVLCHVGDSGKIVIFAIFAKFASIANFYGPTLCFVLCHVGDSGKIVIFAIFAKFAIMFSFLPFLLLRAFLEISLHDGTYINAWTNIDTLLLLLASISVTNILRHRKISLQILPYSKNATASFDRLIYEMFFINELRPSLNVQRDSIRAKVFK